MSAHFPSMAALESNDDDWLASELAIARARSQVAAARALVDQVDRLSLATDAHGLVEGMARLGCRLIEVAGSLAHASRHSYGMGASHE